MSSGFPRQAGLTEVPVVGGLRVDRAEQVELVVGTRYATYYRAQFDRERRGERTLNWAAALLGSLWLLYRRQYARALLLSVFAVGYGVSPYLMGLSGWDAPLWSAKNLLTTLAFRLPVMTYLLLTSNQAYLEFVEGKVDTLRSRLSNAGTARAYATVAHTSVLRALVVGLIIGLIIFRMEVAILDINLSV